MKKTFKPSGDLASSIFFTFLKQNNAYDLFMRNFSNPYLAHGFVNLDCARPDAFISNSFRWASTPEGVAYWHLLDDKWNLVVSLFNL